MNLDAFLARFPEFSETAQPLIEACLAETLVQFNVDVWGKNLDAGHGYLTAHVLSTSPSGQAGRLVTQKDGSTTYWTAYWRLALIAGIGVGRVSGPKLPPPVSGC